MCQRRTEAPARLLRAAHAAASAVLVLTLATACMSAKPKQGTDLKAMDAIAQQIQTTIGQQATVTQARVVYQDNITAPGTASVAAIVKPGANLDSVLDQAARLVWTSKLNPLESIAVDVTDEQDPKRFVSKRLYPKKAEDKTELGSKYGSRPK